MSASLNIKNKVCTALNRFRAVLSYLFHFIHKKFLFGAFKKIDEKFFKFLFVGFLNTLFSYFLYAFFVFMGLKAAFALLLQYIIGIFWNFKTTGTLVFKNNNNKLIFKFFLCYIFTFFINGILLNFLTKSFNSYLSQAVLVLPMAMLSFGILNFWVFKKQK